MQGQEEKALDQRPQQDHDDHDGDEDDEVGDLPAEHEQRQKGHHGRHRRHGHGQEHLPQPRHHRGMPLHPFVEVTLDILGHDDGVVDDDPDDDKRAEQRNDVDGVAQHVDEDDPDGEGEGDPQRHDGRDPDVDEQRHRREHENQPQHQVRQHGVEAALHRLGGILVKIEMDLRVFVLQRRRERPQLLRELDGVALVAFGDVERDVGATVEGRDGRVLGVFDDDLRDVAQPDVFAADFKHRLLPGSNVRLAVNGGEENEIPFLFDVADGVDIGEVGHGRRHVAAAEAQGFDGTRIQPHGDLFVRIAVHGHLADVRHPGETVLDLFGLFDEFAVRQRVAGERQRHERAAAHRQHRDRFDHVRRQVLPALGDSVLGFVQRIVLIRALLQGQDDGETARLDDGLDLVDAVDGAQRVLDVAHGHLVQVVGAGARVTARDADLVQRDQREQFFGDLDVGVDPHEQHEQQQHVVEPLVAYKILDDLQHTRLYRRRSAQVKRNGL